MKNIIILESSPMLGTGIQLNALFWLPVVGGREIPVASAASRFRNASTAEIAELQAGKFVEEPYSQQFPPGATPAQIRAALINAYNDRLAIFNARPNPNQFYGTSWDGAAWSAGGP